MIETEVASTDLNNNEEMADDAKKLLDNLPPKSEEYQWIIVWPKLIGVVLFHVLGIAGLFRLHMVQIPTLIFTMFLAVLTSFGVQAGAHRLWAHRAYKASFGLRVFLAAIFTMCFQSSIHEWVRDHRGHHKVISNVNIPK